MVKEGRLWVISINTDYGSKSYEVNVTFLGQGHLKVKGQYIGVCLLKLLGPTLNGHAASLYNSYNCLRILYIDLFCCHQFIFLQFD